MLSDKEVHMLKAAIVTHVAFEDAGSLARELLRRGFQLLEFDAATAEWRNQDLAMADLLVVLGGPIGAYDTAAYPFLEGEIGVLRERLRRDAPTLGICLGAQLLAAALDAKVFPGRQGKELGWAPLLPGRDRPACPAINELLQTDLRVLHWHGDTFDLPAGASHLAATTRYENQAWCRGPRTLALQFHPEVTARGLERWYVGHAAELSGSRVDIAALRMDTARYAPALEAAAMRFWRSWLDAALGA